jgi:hypothetical protein
MDSKCRRVRKQTNWSRLKPIQTRAVSCRNRHVVQPRGLRELHGLILRRLGQLEGFYTYERIVSMKCFEWPGEVENKIEWFEAQTSLPFRAALGLRIVVREREDGLGISIQFSFFQETYSRLKLSSRF